MNLSRSSRGIPWQDPVTQDQDIKSPRARQYKICYGLSWTLRLSTKNLFPWPCLFDFQKSWNKHEYLPKSKFPLDAHGILFYIQWSCNVLFIHFNLGNFTSKPLFFHFNHTKAKLRNDLKIIRERWIFSSSSFGWVC